MPDNWHRGLLHALASAIRPKCYLELGVGTTPVLPDIEQFCVSAFGVDHVHDCAFKMTTDEFFAGPPRVPPPDLVFVDADHRSAQVLKDLEGLSFICAPDCIVVLHDTFPDPGYEGDSHCSDSYRVPGMVQWENVTIPIHPGCTILRMKPTR